MVQVQNSKSKTKRLSSEMAVKHKRKVLTIEEKVDIIKKLETLKQTMADLGVKKAKS